MIDDVVTNSDRIKILKMESGLNVIHRTINNESYFQFMHGNHTIKSVFTYKKALIFAEGLRAGRMLNRMELI